MAMTPKERDQIVEEETLRFETRRNLHAQQPCRRHGRIWPWCLAFFILGFAVHGLCSRFRQSCPYESAGAPHCMFGSNGAAAPQDGAPK